VYDRRVHSPSQPQGRHARTYLVDPRFQLKYTGLLVAVVLGVMIVLGAVIARTAGTASAYAQLAVAEAERAMNESRANSALARQNVALAAADNPDLAKVMDDALAETDEKAERDVRDVRARRAEIEHQRARIMSLLLVSCAALALVLGAMGILITHRIVGPVYKMKRLLRQVGTGRLVFRDRLRHGDELGDLFNTFMQMTYSIKALQTGRVATLDATIRDAEATCAAPEVMAGLRALRAQMMLGLPGARRSSAPPPPGAIPEKAQ
jgi:nitrogen fixation/metabolism regulation signal transduction histidine kinase